MKTKEIQQASQDFIEYLLSNCGDNSKELKLVIAQIRCKGKKSFGGQVSAQFDDALNQFLKNVGVNSKKEFKDWFMAFWRDQNGNG